MQGRCPAAAATGSTVCRQAARAPGDALTLHVSERRIKEGDDRRLCAARRAPAPAVNAEVIGRLVGLAMLAGLTLLVLTNGIAMPSGVILNFLHLIDLVFHEAGHVIFAFFGRFIAVLGGSLNQVLIPAL